MKGKKTSPKAASADTIDIRDIMRLSDAAKMLHCHQSTLYRLCQRGQIPAFRLGGSWRINRADLERWMKRGTIRPE
jgi:excisionase family DNA binding protein